MGQAAAGIVECDCPSCESTSRGRGLEACKHGRAPVMAGRVDHPDLAAPAAVARAAYDDAREKLAALAEAEAAVRSEAERPARSVAPFDADFSRARDAVAERRALRLCHRHRYASDPRPAPEATPAPPAPAAPPPPSRGLRDARGARGPRRRRMG